MNKQSVPRRRIVPTFCSRLGRITFPAATSRLLVQAATEMTGAHPLSPRMCTCLGTWKKCFVALPLASHSDSPSFFRTVVFHAAINHQFLVAFGPYAKTDSRDASHREVLDGSPEHPGVPTESVNLAKQHWQQRRGTQSCTIVSAIGGMRLQSKESFPFRILQSRRKCRSRLQTLPVESGSPYLINRTKEKVSKHIA